MRDDADIVVIGAGAAGLMASIWAGRAAISTGSRRRIVALDGARTLGAKILVAGGGRCNVTHFEVDESAYAGSSRHAIKKVLRSFDVPRTVAFFEDLGVTLKREATGKLFPTTDNARTVLNAMLNECRRVGVEIVHPWRVGDVARDPASGTFTLREAARPEADPRTLRAHRVILAAGGMALPKSGSDGHGYALARSLGHTVTPRVFPALVPLVLAEGFFLRALSGITLPATIELRAHTGKRLRSFTNSTLLAHFGLSGPGVLDISRYYMEAAADARDAGEPPPTLVLNVLPGETPESLDAALLSLGRRTPLSLLRERLPERLAQALLAHAGIDPASSAATLSREHRRAIAHAATELVLPVTGDRGFVHAEVTAGGVPLSELHLATMESRVTPGLHIIGEICDVDGRIGGFNFQWAWASGHLAGMAAGGA